MGLSQSGGQVRLIFEGKPNNNATISGYYFAKRHYGFVAKFANPQNWASRSFFGELKREISVR